MADIEHPDITHAHKTGHSREDWRTINADNRLLFDYYGVEIDEDSDNYVVLRNGEVIAAENLQRYLEHECGMTFTYDLD